VPDRRSIFHLLALAGFLLTVALALWLAELRPLLVIIVMALALALAWAVGWLSWRQELPRLAAEDASEEEVAEGVLPAAEEAAPREEVPAPLPFEAPAPAPHATDTEPGLEPEPLLPAPATAPEPPQAPVVAPPSEPAPPTGGPSLRPVPSPPPAPEVPPPPVPAAAAAEPVRAAARPAVVDLRTRATAAPRRWNLWDLERRARDEQQRDPIRYEEWSYLFVHLRQFATPDGSLPTEFDGLVRESFGELLEHAG
jgi:outer membrane biosynthesis protein TonB